MGIGWAREALSLNPQVPTPPPLVPFSSHTAKGEKLSPHPRLDLKGHLKPILKLKLSPGITTLVTMDTHIIDIIMGIMATLTTTDITCMANKFENSFSLIHTRKKLENHGNLTLAMIMDKKDKTARAPQQIQNCIHTIELINR